MRGSPLRSPDRTGKPRSIPACAGEPADKQVDIFLRQVDPRVCGGASHLMRQYDQREGRSPRVRGSPPRRSAPRDPARSIPACAGEPAAPEEPIMPPGVDPRVCGGAKEDHPPSCGAAGRSPRVRGSRNGADAREGIDRSIPACAGEPTAGRWHWSTWRVDPRVCGGAPVQEAAAEKLSGRSPRVRGSRRSRSDGGRRYGSIPACAGEPAI